MREKKDARVEAAPIANMSALVLGPLGVCSRDTGGSSGERTLLGVANATATLSRVARDGDMAGDRGAEGGRRGRGVLRGERLRRGGRGLRGGRSPSSLLVPSWILRMAGAPAPQGRWMWVGRRGVSVGGAEGEAVSVSLPLAASAARRSSSATARSVAWLNETSVASRRNRMATWVMRPSITVKGVSCTTRDRPPTRPRTDTMRRSNAVWSCNCPRCCPALTMLAPSEMSVAVTMRPVMPVSSDSNAWCFNDVMFACIRATCAAMKSFAVIFASGASNATPAGREKT
mmetsp:Transcript_45004/g.106114  ORF Transcript_45004/g.106114 Transcript_45004/m.106114 type:complete len:287 (-) Transcript_45004:211-1071(-)